MRSQKQRGAVTPRISESSSGVGRDELLVPAAAPTQSGSALTCCCARPAQVAGYQRAVWPAPSTQAPIFAVHLRPRSRRTRPSEPTPPLWKPNSVMRAALPASSFPVVHNLLLGGR